MLENTQSIVNAVTINCVFVLVPFELVQLVHNLIMNTTMQQLREIDINLIEATSDTQSRVGLDENTIAEYAEAMEGGASFPPIVLFFDGDKYCLGDGFHRVYACKRANLGTIAAFVHAGSRRDALLYSAGANALHGLRRSNADKRRAVEILLRDEEWSKWSDREIARRCGVSDRMVNKLRAESSANCSQMQERTVNRNGVTYTQNIGNIGHGQAFRIHKNGVIDIEAESLGLVENDDQSNQTQPADSIDELTHTSPADVDDRPGPLLGGAIAASIEVTNDASLLNEDGKAAAEPSNPRSREENDFYPTPPGMTKKLLECITINGRIIEPCAGDGAIAKLLPGCVTNDLYPRPEYACDYNLDAAKPEDWEKLAEEGIDWVVTNPPFENAPEIIPLAFQHATVGLAALLRLSYLEPCKDRADWLQKNADHLANVLILNPRSSFRKGSSGGDQVTVAWLVWRKDWSWKQLGLECPITFAHGWKKLQTEELVDAAADV